MVVIVTGEAFVVVPPVVYVPCDAMADADGELTVDLRPTKDGQIALIVYTALDRLVACCGPHQPWVVMPTANLEKIREHVHFDMILFDIEVPEELRRKAA
jgi:hypothetical protein